MEGLSRAWEGWMEREERGKGGRSKRSKVKRGGASERARVVDFLARPHFPFFVYLFTLDP